MPQLPADIFDADDEVIPGCWRAEIASVEDSEERARYRVRIFHFHDESIPPEHLPFAEAGGSFSFKGGGDVPSWEVGDLVWVMFEGGNREYPVILGGWLSESQGIPDFLPEQQESYAQNRKRWFRIDRAGNFIELSSVPGQEQVRIRAGRAEVLLSKLDNGIEITAQDGPIRLNAERVTLQSEELQLEGGNLDLLAQGQTPPVDPEAAIPIPGVASGVLNVFSNKAVNLYGGSIPGTDLLGEVKIGQYVDAALAARQSGLVRLQPQQLDLGVAVPTDGTLPTLFVDASATRGIRVLAPLVTLGVEATADFLVKFTDFKTQFDTHTHPGVTSGPSATGVPVPLLPTTATVNVKAS